VDDRIAQLTPKEMEVLRYLFSGMSVSEIALHVSRSVTTVSSHKMAAMRKLGAENDHELIMFCVHNGLFTS
jgi:two-component system capsular synthesis response regulator RcsB